MVLLEPIPWYKRLAPFVRTLDIPLLVLLLLLMLAGLVTMYSSGYDHGVRFYDHLRNMVLSLIILVIVANTSPQRFMAMAIPLYTIGVALLLAVMLFGLTRKGARRWLNVGIVIQPSEILKIAIPLMMAWWFQLHEGHLRKFDWIVAGILLLIPVALIAKQPDLGTALLVLLAGLAVIFFAGTEWKYVLPPVFLGVIGMAILVIYQNQLCADGVQWPILHDYQQQRVCTLLDPMRDPLGAGFHVIQAMIGIGSGGWTGAGFLQGTQTHLEFIPERTTDFIFAAYSEEFGFLGNIFLIIVYFLLVLRGFMIALAAPTLFTRLLAGSLSIIFFAYVFVNMGMVSGLLPVVGVPLPFLSYGGTAMLTLALAIGMLMSIARNRRVI